MANRKNKRSARRAFCMTLVIVFCLCFLLAGIMQSYENTRRIGFGEYKSALELQDGYLRILDFEIYF